MRLWIFLLRWCTPISLIFKDHLNFMVQIGIYIGSIHVVYITKIIKYTIMQPYFPLNLFCLTHSCSFHFYDFMVILGSLNMDTFVTMRCAILFSKELWWKKGCSKKFLWIKVEFDKWKIVFMNQNWKLNWYWHVLCSN